jgi:branched-chain amino acid transport system permease protein
MRSWTFFLVALAVGAAFFAGAMTLRNDYLFFAGYVVLQYIVLATAWNILGGYCGYVNFGTAAFFALGAYSSVALHKLGANIGRYASGPVADILQLVLPLSIPGMVLIGGLVSGIVGLGMGYLTLRLRGVFFAIATLAMAVVLQTLMINWDFVGGSRGAYVIRPAQVSLGPFTFGYIEYLFLIMLLLAVLSLTVARLIERSRLGYGFATIRDDELAAEATGVPTLRLKLIATTISGAFMGMAGAPLPYYLGYIEPGATFGLPYAVNSIAMPMIGGTTSWVGPLIGAILLASLQQIATVTINSAVNLLIVGVLLVAFVIAAPVGIVGLVRDFLRAAAPSRPTTRALSIIFIASYCFIVGILGIIFNLPGLQSQSALVAWLGVSALIVGSLLLASAYGLLKLQSWGPLVATIALISSIVFAATHIWLDRMSASVRWWAVAIAIAAAAIWYLQNKGVSLLYNRPLADRPVAA